MASPNRAHSGLAAALKSTSVAMAIAALAACGGGGGGDSTATSGTGGQPSASGAPSATGAPPATGTPTDTGTPATSPSGTGTGSGGTTPSTPGTPGTGSGSPATGGPSSPAVFQRTDFQVNTQTAGSQSGANVARLANGGYAVVWDSTSVAFGPTEVHLQRLDAQGRAVGGEQVVSAHGNFSQVTAFADGRFLVTWRVSPFALEVDAQGQMFDAQGAPLGTTIALGSAVNGYTPRPMALPDGSFVAAIDSEGGGKFGPSFGVVAHFAADGTPLGQPTRLESQLSVQTGAYSPNSAGQAHTALLRDGRIATVWVASGTAISELRLSLFDGQVQPLGSYVVLDTRAVPIQSPSIAVLADGRYAVTWVAGASGQPQTAYLELFDANGASLGRQELAGSQGAVGATPGALTPRLAALADGSLVAAWSLTSWDPTQGHRQLSLRRFDAAGVPLGAAEQVDASTWTPDDLPSDSLGLAGTTGAGFMLLSGRWTAAQSWDVRATVR
jgi:hypothetical protein